MSPRLKSLELIGYKTFASRTVFEYDSPITAIVGPNGSGKSNIADSLRWVLGEQSYRLLRGKKTEDMIFAGSEQRPRAGMASATVTFDNVDGWLPIDFSEVAITRRAYRDGQNEYLINGQRVRLKDVTELLAQSGLAERTYTIIGQGLVDAALSLKAEERRRLFEEAAGISLHRSRREEALRRLETTRRNLDRVQDILAELQPRLRSLERQARRAKEYEQVRADLRVLLREWYGYHWHHAQIEINHARKVARIRQNELNRARVERDDLDKKLAIVRDKIQGLREGLNSWHRNLAQLHTHREKLSRESAVRDERHRSLRERQLRLQIELARLEEERGLQQARLATATQEVGRLSNELNEAQSQADTTGQRLLDRKNERAEIENKVKAAQKSMSAQNARSEQLKARLGERRANIERGQIALEADKQAVNTADGDVEEAREGVHAASQELQAAVDARREAERTKQAHNLRLSGLETTRKSILEKVNSLSAGQTRLQAQLDVLDQAENSLTGFAAGAQVLLMAARQNRLKGSRGALSVNLEVPVELETAVASVLGEYLDAVILEGGGDLSEEALDLLLGADTRGALLPIDYLTSEPPLTFREGEGVLGVAASLVKAPLELRQVVDLLLGKVIVVRDRQAARLSLVGQAPTVRAVTLRGEVFHANGTILAGHVGTSTTLSRPRKRQELRVQITQADRQGSDLNEQVDQLDAEIKALQDGGVRVERELHLAHQHEEKAQDAHRHAKFSLERSTTRFHWHTEQCQSLETEIKSGVEEASRFTSELNKLTAEIAETRERIGGQNDELAGLSLLEFQSQVTHWSTLATVAKRALTDGQARCDEQRETFKRAEKALDTARVHLEEIGGTLKALETEKIAQRKTESEVGEKIEELQTLIRPSEIELDLVEQELDRKQAADVNDRQALSKLEHDHAQTRVTLASRQDAMEVLRLRIEDDFGLVDFEYAEEISGPTPLPLEGMVEKLPRRDQIAPGLETNIKRLRVQLRRMGAVNPEAQVEYQEVEERFRFLTGQVEDLEKAEVDIRRVIAELNVLMEREFFKTFEAVAKEFETIFTRLFGGGMAKLVLTDPNDLTNSGIDIEARLPGRRTQGLMLLSGGERSLAATALVFALLKVSPTPFCVLDEVDAMLDEENVARFSELLRELSQSIQFILVTHNRNTVQVADVIYGVTMGRDSTSKVVSLKLDEVSQVVD